MVDENTCTCLIMSNEYAVYMLRACMCVCVHACVHVCVCIVEMLMKYSDNIPHIHFKFPDVIDSFSVNCLLTD